MTSNFMFLKIEVKNLFAVTLVRGYDSGHLADLLNLKKIFVNEMNFCLRPNLFNSAYRQ